MQKIHILINLAILTITIILTKKSMDKEYKIGHYPEDLYLSAEELNYLMTSTNYIERGIVGSLLDLNRRAIIQINPYQKQDKDKSRWEFEFILNTRDQTSQLEKEFLSKTFDGKSTTNTEEITQRNQDLGSSFFEEWGDWALSIEKSLEEKGLTTSQRTQEEKSYYMLGIAMAIISVVLLFMTQNPLYIIGLFASLLVILVYMRKSLRKTPRGNAVIKKYQDLKEKLSNEEIETDDPWQMIQLIALSQPMKDYKDVFIGDSNTINIFTEYKNENGGSSLDDAVQRAFLGYRKPTSSDSLDTNRQILS